MRILFVFLTAFYLTGLHAQQQPVIDSDFPDPTVISAGGKYYAYATNSGTSGKWRHIQVAVSENLIDWKILGDALPEQPVWADHDFWAPHVLYNERLKKFVLFYSGETIDKKAGKAIGVAFSEKPEGPFTDMGRPLLVRPGFEAIDPMTLKDPQSGNYYMVWGSASQPIRIREMAADMTGFAKHSKEIELIPAGADQPYGRLIEGAWIDYDQGFYYLYYSGDNCCGVNAHYAVMVARAEKITGPYTRFGAVAPDRSGVILGQDSFLVAPGHNSVFSDRAGNKWIAYHAIPRGDFKKGSYHRLMYLNRIVYENGWPVVVQVKAPSIKINWTDSVTISTGYSNDAQGNTLRPYGAQYPRLLKLKNNKWLAAYTVLKNRGYKEEADGGLELEISESGDNGKTWTPVGSIKDPGRDMDNAQMIQLPDGALLLAGRSVRWQESYRLPVYKSTDNGKTWQYLSTIDANEGAPGSLGKPDKGIYEPHFYFLKDGQLAVMYANEKHVTGTPSYSQIISERISADFGKTWGKEIWVAHTPGHPLSRPGMPVVDRINDGNYIAVYEVCGPEDCGIYYKTSIDGIHWNVGLGTKIPGQKAAPYILALSDGNLVVCSNLGTVSVSNDNGLSWKQQEMPWSHAVPFETDWTQTLWQSIYQFNEQTIGVVTSHKRAGGGHDIKIRFGRIEKIN
ncbi:MAG TPA: family 43 glycosylhydrolase [Niabella sp.]